MALLETSEIAQLNDKIETFVLINPSAADDDDVTLFVLQPPPAERDPAHRAPIESSIGSLCAACCSALEYFAFYLSNLPQSQTKAAADKLPAACLVHAGATTLQDGDTARCHLCVQLMATLRVKRLAMASIDASNIEMCWQQPSDDTAPKVARLHFALTHRGHARSEKNYWNILTLRLRAPDPLVNAALDLADSQRTLERHASTNSPQTRAHALQWLARCQADADGAHGQCNNRPSSDEGRLPTRLLDVAAAAQTGALRVVAPLESPGEFASAEARRYMTLSHCWGVWGGGSAGLPVLTEGNLAERLAEGIAVARLPQTFQDAVEIATWFDVRWLWIDSLCIVQDSAADWQREAAAMHGVYRAALLNIAADDSPDARFGCFRNRDPLAVLPMRVRLPLPDSGDGDSDGWWLMPDARAVFEGVAAAPLTRRGWVFQERQLARRVLHFTSHELVWECCARVPHFASETFPGGGLFSAAAVFGGKPKFQAQTDLAASAPSAVHAAWAALCREYSGTTFSFARDKPVALSGLAKEFAAALPGNMYLAGLWRSTLPGALLWESAGGAGRLPDGEGYVAPSWSWLSMAGAVSPAASGSSALHEIVEVLAATTDPVLPSAPTGSLNSASLSLRCYMRRVEVQPDYEAKPWYMMAIGGGKHHKLRVLGDGGEEEAVIGSILSDAFDYSFDAAEDEDEGGRPEAVAGWFLPLCASPADGSSPLALSGLLVEAVAGGDGDTFRRVGVLRVYGAHCRRIKYRYRGVVGGESAGWDGLERGLKASHEGVDEGVESVDEDVGVEVDDREAEDILEGMDMDSVGDEEAVQPRADIDLGSGDPLERLYALDRALAGSELEAQFERLVPRRITLV
ncbi:heterokaryon incompatibility protein-domain-containing protein [Lasiosphaeria ovina]|uniref:Heterokaryon incompatibility protein-domain-containing protein n=1 Tax=Lasiosphaeria ovina TaxID=92902 RepID=A0AAE0TUL4_9PEZI|nr:heterokaryon incompatibility protein-domain-containing protein [Lasiosphaeria ovina]